MLTKEDSKPIISKVMESSINSGTQTTEPLLQDVVQSIVCGSSNDRLKDNGLIFPLLELQPNASKIEISCIHLSNKLAIKELNILFENTIPRCNKTLKHLVVTINRTLPFKEHLMETASTLCATVSAFVFSIYE